VSLIFRWALGYFEIPKSRLASLPNEGAPQAEHAALKVHVLPLEKNRSTNNMLPSSISLEGMGVPMDIEGSTTKEVFEVQSGVQR
jgi:hypothetical protein